jgi:hypothetical protein
MHPDRSQPLLALKYNTGQDNGCAAFEPFIMKHHASHVSICKLPVQTQRIKSWCFFAVQTSLAILPVSGSLVRLISSFARTSSRKNAVSLLAATVRCVVAQHNYVAHYSNQRRISCLLRYHAPGRLTGLITYDEDVADEYYHWKKPIIPRNEHDFGATYGTID